MKPNTQAPVVKLFFELNGIHFELREHLNLWEIMFNIVENRSYSKLVNTFKVKVFEHAAYTLLFSNFDNSKFLIELADTLMFDAELLPDAVFTKTDILGLLLMYRALIIGNFKLPPRESK